MTCSLIKSVSTRLAMLVPLLATCSYGAIANVTAANVTAGSATGTVGVTVSDPTAATSPITIAGYTLNVQIVPENGATGSVSLTGASVPSGAALPGTFFGATPLGGALLVTDAELSATDTLTASPLALVNLGYSVAAGTSGRFDVVFNTSAAPASELYDTAGASVPGTTFTAGSITVIPEPTILAGGLCLAFGLAGRQRSVKTP